MTIGFRATPSARACYSPTKFASYVGGPQIPPQRETDSSYLYEIYKKMPIYQGPSLPQKPGNQDFVLDYTINSIDWKR